MGLPFALHLKGAGHEVTVINRSDRPYETARKAGLRIAETLEDCVDASDILFTCLPSSKIIDETYARIQKPGLICCDNSTVPHEQALKLNAELKERGMAYVECPIFGSAKKAQDGAVYLVISGDAVPVQRVMPIASVASRGISNVGGPGTASLVKILQNGLGHVQMVAMAQTLAAAQLAGIDLDRFVEVVSDCGGMASTPLFRRKAPQMLRLPQETGAKLQIATKDAEAAARLFQRLGAEGAMADSAYHAYAEAESMGLAELDFAAVVKVFAAKWTDLKEPKVQNR